MSACLGYQPHPHTAQMVATCRSESMALQKPGRRGQPHPRDGRCLPYLLAMWLVLPADTANCFTPLSSDGSASVTIVFPASVDSSTQSPVERDRGDIWTGEALAHLAGLLPPADTDAITQTWARHPDPDNPPAS